MNELPAWRVYLNDLVGRMSKEEKKLLYDAVKVTRTTVLRWRTGENTPDTRHLHLLLQALAEEQRRRFLSLLHQDPRMRALLSSDAAHALYTISSECYADVFRHQRETPNAHWSLCGKILRCALDQLAPMHGEEGGIEITFLRCMPPRDGKIRSLHKFVSIGMAPWRSDIHTQELFLGAESMAGYALTKRRGIMIPNLGERQGILPPVHLTEHEQSTAAYPILLPEKVVGVFVVSSNQVNYFSPGRLLLIEQYADLMRIACDPAWFYPSALVDLHCLPLWTEQKNLFASLHAQLTGSYGQFLSEAQGGLDAVEQHILNQLEEAVLCHNMERPLVLSADLESNLLEPLEVRCDPA